MKMELIPGPVPLSLGTHSLTQHIAPRCQFQEVCFPHHQDPRLPITFFSFFIIKIPSRDRMSVTWSWHNNNLPMRLWKIIFNLPGDGYLYPEGHLVFNSRGSLICNMWGVVLLSSGFYGTGVSHLSSSCWKSNIMNKPTLFISFSLHKVMR